MVSIKEQIDELRREIDRREAILPGAIEAGKISKDMAESRMAALRAALDTLVWNSQAGTLISSEFSGNKDGAPGAVTVRYGAKDYRFERSAP